MLWYKQTTYVVFDCGGRTMKSLAEKVSDSELEIMRVLWEAGEPLPIAQIRKTVQERKGWESTTVKTLVQRLCRKGVVEQEKRTTFFYRAKISEQEYNDWATGDLIRKVYKGSAKDLVAALVHSDSLSEEDISELRGFFKMEE